MNDTYQLTWLAGPDAGCIAALTHGRTFLGRSADNDIHCEDAMLEAHHALFEIDVDGVHLVQLAGRTPLRVDGQVLADRRPIHPGSLLEIGRGLARLDLADIPFSAAHVLRRAVIRSPRVIPSWAPEPIVAPVGEDSPTGGGLGALVPAVLGLVGSVVMATLMHQPMFLIFGAIGALVGIGGWVAQRFGLLRRGRRNRRRTAAAMVEFERSLTAQHDDRLAYLRARTGSAAEALTTLVHRTANLWQRRAGHGDAFVVSLGIGDVAWQPAVEVDRYVLAAATTALERAAITPRAPVSGDLGPGARLAVVAPPEIGAGVVRSLLLQLAANCGPADVRFVVVTHHPHHWRWLERLDHARSGDGTWAVVGEAGLSEVLASFDVTSPPHVVLITDSPELLAARTAAIRRAVIADRQPALIALLPDGTSAPQLCTSVLTVATSMLGRWVADTSVALLPQPVRCSAVGRAAALRAIASITELVDPEDAASAASNLPRQLGLLELLAASGTDARCASAIAATWLAAGADPSPRTPIGIAADGSVEIDLVADGPHALMAGTTGSGKSELLRSMVVGMAALASPDHLVFVLVDYKGGSTFDACAALPHVVGMVTDLDDRMVNRALRSLHAELRRRETILRQHAVGDLPGLRHAHPDVILPRLVVVIDEFAALVAEQPDFLHALVGVAQRGRSLGVHLLLATQRPSGVISDDIRANTNLRIALRLQDVADANDVIDDPSPALLPRTVPGRAVMRLGPDELVTFQTARCTAPAAVGLTELQLAVATIRDANDWLGVAPPTRPWAEPLPKLLFASEAGGLGTVDDPDRQATEPLTWNRAAGHLVLAGMLGSGLTTSLISLAGVTASDARAHLYVVDAIGDERLDHLVRDVGCGGVVRLHEGERLLRLLLGLAGELDRRSAVGGQRPDDPDIVLAIDGYVLLRRHLDDLSTTSQFEALERIIATGPSVGLSAVLTVDQPGAVPASTLARCAERWVFHLSDAHDAAALGVHVAAVPAAVPGRIIVASSGREAQVALADPPSAAATPLTTRAHSRPTMPMSLAPLPEFVDADDLRPSRADADTSWLSIGLDFARLDTGEIEVPDGEHVMIVGGARSGRTTTLRRTVAAWRDVHPDGWSAVVRPRKPDVGFGDLRTLTAALERLPPSGHVLLAVDDAELTADEGQVLAARLATRPPGLTVIVAGSGGGLRGYGHWTSPLRRSRLGVVMTIGGDSDGDVLGASIPRRPPLAPRPGLGWLIGGGTLRLIQVAADEQLARAGVADFSSAPIFDKV